MNLLSQSTSSGFCCVELHTLCFYVAFTSNKYFPLYYIFHHFLLLFFSHSVLQPQKITGKNHYYVAQPSLKQILATEITANMKTENPQS
jgi:hypothetical protein